MSRERMRKWRRDGEEIPPLLPVLHSVVLGFENETWLSSVLFPLDVAVLPSLILKGYDTVVSGGGYGISLPVSEFEIFKLVEVAS